LNFKYYFYFIQEIYNNADDLEKESLRLMTEIFNFESFPPAEETEETTNVEEANPIPELTITKKRGRLRKSNIGDTNEKKEKGKFILKINLNFF